MQDGGLAEFDLSPEDPINWTDGIELIQRKSVSNLYSILG